MPFEGTLPPMREEEREDAAPPSSPFSAPWDRPLEEPVADAAGGGGSAAASSVGEASYLSFSATLHDTVERLNRMNEEFGKRWAAKAAA